MEAARKKLQALIEKYNADKTKSLSEADVVTQYIEPLLRDVLGWNIEDSNRYRKELHTSAGRPDVTLIPENGGNVFLEAKKFGVIKQLEQARYTLAGTITPGQLALPGMAVDRTQEEQQAINYAYQNGGTWAILTNFEKLRLFNARRDWLVLSFESPAALLDDFDLLMYLSYESVLEGKLDTLSNQRHREDVDTQYLNFINEWRERLAHDLVLHVDQNPWLKDETGDIRLDYLRSVVQRFLDRLVVVRFAEDHLVIPPGTLQAMYDLRVTNPYTFSMDEFIDRLFRRFDEDHNSALFAKGLTDQARFSDDVLMPLIGKLYEARYRAMPADILGNTYEQYLGKALALENQIIVTRDNLETRKKQGSYYTPQVIVQYIVENSLGRYLEGKTSQDIRDLRILDSACGSGSFLIYAYYVLASFYEAEIKRLDDFAVEQVTTLTKQALSRIDIELEIAPIRQEIERIRDYPRLILETHLYGVDLDPQAAEIAVVNLMMRGMEKKGISKRLPLLLNQNLKVGNGLIGMLQADSVDHPQQLAQLIALRQELIQTANTDPRHDDILQEIESIRAALYAEFDFSAQFDDHNRVRPFHWGVEFPEVFFKPDGTLQQNPGFTIIIGNPPWEILKPDLREFYAQFDERIESRLSRAQAERRITELQQEDPTRQALWETQSRLIEQSAAYFRASQHYTRQGRGDTATHKLFIERMYGMLADGGRLGYVVPSGINTDLGTADLRDMLLSQGSIQYMFSFSNERWFFKGVHHAFRFTMIGAQKGSQSDGFWSVFRYNPRVAIAPDDMRQFVDNKDNLVYMKVDMLKQFSPESLSIMEFQDKQDYEIASKIYSGHPLLGEETDAWNIKLNREFDMTNDRNLFNTRGEGLPLYEGKMIHQYDAFFAEPQYWINESKGRQKLIGKNEKDSGQQLNYQKARLVYRDVAASTNERSFIAAIVPPSVFVGNTGIVETQLNDKEMLFFLSMVNSFCLDHIIRSKITNHVSMFYVHQLPVPRLTAGDKYFDAIVPRAARLICTHEAFADLWQSVMGSTWDATCGAHSADERQRLRDEIDGLVAHLYGLTEAEYNHILGTFPLVFPEGNPRRDQVLEIYREIM